MSTSHLEKYEPVIGLEVHVQLATQTKIFASSSAQFGLAPNGATDPVVLGLLPFRWLCAWAWRWVDTSDP